MKHTLALDKIIGGFPGITKVIGAHLLEACAITLHRKKHVPGVIMTVSNGRESYDYQLQWSYPVDEQIDRAWRDQLVATEHAAVCVAILLALEVTGYSVIERSIRKDGCDYWLGDGNGILFQNKARLEVSGIFTGDEKSLLKRFKEKTNQTNQSDSSGLPAYVSVTEFNQPLSRFAQK